MDRESKIITWRRRQVRIRGKTTKETKELKRSWKNSELSTPKATCFPLTSEGNTTNSRKIRNNFSRKSKLSVILEELKKVKSIELINKLNRVMGLKLTLTHVKFWSSLIIWRNWIWAISNRFKRKSIRLFNFSIIRRTLEKKLLSWWTKLNSKVKLKGKGIT